MAKKKRGRGRPVKMNVKQRRAIASMVRKHGTASRVAEILGAGNRTKDAKLRPKAFPQPVSVSLPTVSKYAAEHGIELQRGRPKKAA